MDDLIKRLRRKHALYNALNGKPADSLTDEAEAAAALSEAQATIARLEAENAGLKAAILALSKDAAARAAQSDGDGE